MRKKLITAIILIVSLPVIAYFIAEDIRCYGYLKTLSEVNHRQVDSVNMSGRDRMKDFDTLWKVVSEGIPAVSKYNDEFGYDILSSKEKYQNAVENADSDIEFFCVMQSVLNDVPSAHTGFFFPDYKIITDYNCMASEIVRTNPWLRDSTEFWNRQMKQYYRDSRALEFEYIDGCYCYSRKKSDVKLPEINYILKSVNGKSPDEYAAGVLSSSQLGYDEEYGKLYRRSLVFNDSNGDRLVLELEDENGRITSEEVYYNLCDEYMYVNQPYLHGAYEKPDDIFEVRWLETGSEKKTAYVRIDDLDNDRGNDLYSKIKKYCSEEDASVILDLRRNGGGTVEYTCENVYAPLFSESVNIKGTEYILKSSGNRDFFRGIYCAMNVRTFGMRKLASGEAARLLPDMASGTFYEYSIETEFKGMNKNSPFVCVLVSDRTGSAADYLVSAVAKLENTVIIGENTGGEKTGGQFLAMLPESRLVYYYNASVCLNDDGTDNSLYGTAPDIRCRLSTEGYMKRCRLESEGKNPDLLSNRPEWDDVLAEALKAIENH